jgi:pimeloyl-ACP methyl ester carboxylesterase
MSAIFLQGEVVHYEVLGRGKPVVFLHSWLGSWRYWIPTMQATSISYRAYALDLWGFGDSSKKVDNYSLDQQINLLDGFLDRLGINKIALVGHGLGAIVAILFAYRHRQLVDRLMAVGLPDGSPTLKARLLTASTKEFIEWLSNRNSDPVLNGAEAAKTDPAAIQASLSSLLKLNLPWYSQQLEAPCLYIHGQADPLAEDGTSSGSISQSSEFTQQIIFEQSGHYPMLDEASKFQRLVIDFLSTQSAEGIQQLQIKEEWKRRVR